MRLLEDWKNIVRAELDLWWAYRMPIKRRVKWVEINIPENIQQIPAKDLPDTIDEVDANGESPDFSGNILEKAIVCEESGRLFRIIKMELEFYRKMWLPLPRKHPSVRYVERLNKKPKRELHLRTCDKCATEMISVYPQNADFKVYCEACYNKEVYW